MADDDQTMEPTEEEGSCCGGKCSCGLDKEVSADDLALVSLITGVMSLFLTTAWTPAQRFMGLLLAATAVVTGWTGQRSSRREKQAIAGIVCGTLGLTWWLLVAWAPSVARFFTG